MSCKPSGPKEIVWIIAIEMLLFCKLQRARRLTLPATCRQASDLCTNSDFKPAILDSLIVRAWICSVYQRLAADSGLYGQGCIKLVFRTSCSFCLAAGCQGAFPSRLSIVSQKSLSLQASAGCIGSTRPAKAASHVESPRRANTVGQAC
jgi:hypothetical protein